MTLDNYYMSHSWLLFFFLLFLASTHWHDVILKGKLVLLDFNAANHCFLSGNCNKLLDSTTCTEHDGDAFCRSCYGKLFGPKGYGFAGGSSGLSMDTGNPHQPTRRWWITAVAWYTCGGFLSTLIYSNLLPQLLHFFMLYFYVFYNIFVLAGLILIIFIKSKK